MSLIPERLKILGAGTGLVLGIEMIVSDIFIVGAASVAWDLANDGYVARGDWLDFKRLNPGEISALLLGSVGIGLVAMSLPVLIQRLFNSRRDIPQQGAVGAA